MHVSTTNVVYCNLTYPIHCSAGGKLGGFIHKGDSLRYISSSAVYFRAIILICREVAELLNAHGTGQGCFESPDLGCRLVVVISSYVSRVGTRGE
jgi:hypothetical protein